MRSKQFGTIQEIAIVDKETGEVVYVAETRKQAAQWFVDQKLAKCISTALSCITKCIRDQQKSMYGYVLYPSFIVRVPVPKMPAIVSIEVETCYNKWITIDRGYIMITDRPKHRIDFNNDAEIEAHVRGFDRYDGEDYYKSYENPYIVELIAALIKDLHI